MYGPLIEYRMLRASLARVLIRTYYPKKQNVKIKKLEQKKSKHKNRKKLWQNQNIKIEKVVVEKNQIEKIKAKKSKLEHF